MVRRGHRRRALDGVRDPRVPARVAEFVANLLDLVPDRLHLLIEPLRRLVRRLDQRLRRRKLLLQRVRRLAGLVDRSGHRVQAHQRLLPRPAVARRHRPPRLRHHLDLGGKRLAPRLHADRVRAGEDDRPPRRAAAEEPSPTAASRPAAALALVRCVVAPVPDHLVDPLLRRRVQRAHMRSRGIRDRQRERAVVPVLVRALVPVAVPVAILVALLIAVLARVRVLRRRRLLGVAQVVADAGPAGRVRGAVGGAVEGPVPALRPHDRAVAEHAAHVGQHPLGERLQRRHVGEDIEAAPMRADDEIVLARVNEDVVHGHRGQVVLQLHPALAPIHGDEDADLVADEEEVRRPVVLDDHVHGPPVREPVRDRPPALPVVLAHVGVRRVVPVPVPIEGRVHPPLDVVGRFHAAHVGARRQARDAVDDVLPRLPVVARHLEVAVVRPRVDEPRHERRLLHRGEVAVVRDPVVERHLRLGARHPHDLQLLAVDRLREVESPDLLPRHPVVARAQQVVRPQVDRGRVVRRQQEGRVPVVAVRLRRVPVRPRPYDRTHGNLLPRRQVVAVHVPALRLRVDDGGVRRVDDREEAVPVRRLVPVLVPDAVEGARVRGSAPRVVVLQPSAHRVRRAHVEADGVELAERDVVEHAPVRGPVPRRRHPAVAPQDQVVGILRVDPQLVVVDVDLHRAIVAERAPTVIRDRELRAEDVDAVRVARVDADLGVVHRTRVRVGHLLPRLAAIRGAEEPALPRAAAAAPEPLPRLARIRLDERVHEVPVPPVDVDPDAALVALGETLREFHPGVAAVHGAVEAAAGPAAVEAPPRPLPLVHGREDRVRVRRVHGEVDGARVLVDVEHPLPRVAAVPGSEHAALLVRPPKVADRRYVDDVRVARVDEHAGDVLRRLQPLVRPRVAAVRRLVDAVPPRRGLPVLGLARPHPHEVRVRLMDRHVPDRTRRLVIEERRPRGAVVLRLPQAARGGAEVEDLGLRLDDIEVRDASPHERRAKLPVLQVGDRGLERGLGRGGRGCGRDAEQESGGGERNESGCLHDDASQTGR